MARGVLFLVLAFLGVLIAGSDVGASQNTPWTGGGVVVSRNDPYVPGISSKCEGYAQDRYIVELHTSYRVCLFGSGGFKIGYFSDGGPYRGVVQFPMSENLYLLEGVCSGVPCSYSSETDTLVTQQVVTGGHRGVIAYLNASDKVKRVTHSGGSKKYVFDAPQPDFAVKNNVGYYVPSPTFSISKNGKWAVFELRNSGIGVVNLDTREVRQITTAGYQYGYGMDPSLELAVSDDGRSVAVTGQNGGFRVFDVTESCGQELIGSLTKLPGTTDCPSTDLGIGALFPNFYGGVRPVFYGEGRQLEVIVQNWVEQTRIVTFLAGNVPPTPKLKLLALGDSFTSGEGEVAGFPYMQGTDVGFDRCHVSSRSYPFLVAAKIGISGNDIKSVACAGATTGDIYGPASEYWGQGNRLGHSGLNLPRLEKIQAENDAVANFQPGRAEQSKFLERYTPEKVLIGIGGNDAGLMGKLRTCVMPGTCEWAKGEGLIATASEIRRLYDILGATFAKISASSPSSGVYVVGYPNIIHPDGACDAITRTLLDHDERVFIENSISYLNKILKAAAKKAEFTYLDVEQAMNGKLLCSGGTPLAMNAIRSGDDISIGGSLPMLKIIGSETFHPTPLGHSLVADTIFAANPQLMKAGGCSTDPMACIDLEPDISAPSYWSTDASFDRVSFVTDFAAQAETYSPKITITIPDGTLEPGSVGQIEIRSKTEVLANVAVNADGGYSGSVIVPESVLSGFHTLHFLGVNKSGEQVDLYQFLTIRHEGDVEEQLIEETFGGVGGSSIDRLFEDAASTGSVNPIPSVAEADRVAVLGASSGSFVTPKLDKGTKAEAAKNHTPLTKMPQIQPWAILGIVIAGLLALSGISLLILRRRWAKPSS